MDIGNQLGLVASEMKVTFTINSREVPTDEIFTNAGLLPAIIRRADQLCSFCLGYGLGITFEEAPGAKLGVHVKFDDVVPHVLRLMCATEIIYELIESSPDRQQVALDDLLYD